MLGQIFLRYIGKIFETTVFIRTKSKLKQSSYEVETDNSINHK
jgi:hypothetical protein